MVSSPGGHVESGDAIHDMIRFVRAPVTTIGSGWVASAGTHIFLAAPPTRRVCLPNTRFMIHTGRRAGGPATDSRSSQGDHPHAERIAASSPRDRQSFEKVKADMERDFWMSADERRLRIVSRVIETHRDLK